MAWFGRRGHDTGAHSAWSPAFELPGWSLVSDDPPFDQQVADVVGRINDARDQAAALPHRQYYAGTNFHDAYETTVEGRSIVVANGWRRLQPGETTLGGAGGCSIVAVEVPTMLTIVSVRPTRFRDYVHLGALITGDAAFDACFAVCGQPAGLDLLTEPVRHAIMTHDDWFVHLDGPTACCVGNTPFESPDQVHLRVRDALQLVAALPTALVPPTVDHLPDELLTRITAVTSLEDGMTLLQQLTPRERDQLRVSNTPFAELADVRTPQQAMARFAAMSPAAKAQLMAQFMRAPH